MDSDLANATGEDLVRLQTQAAREANQLVQASIIEAAKHRQNEIDQLRANREMFQSFHDRTIALQNRMARAAEDAALAGMDAAKAMMNQEQEMFERLVATCMSERSPVLTNRTADATLEDIGRDAVRMARSMWLDYAEFQRTLGTK